MILESCFIKDFQVVIGFLGVGVGVLEEWEGGLYVMWYNMN